MTTEDEIARRLLQGYTPNQLIDDGYRKSTVYKVYKEIRARESQTNKPEWTITNLYPAEPRAMPKETRTLSFQFENNSTKDAYLNRVGIFAEWMETDTWIAQDVKELIKPGQKRYFSLLIPVREGIALGEYAMTIGVELQYLPANEYQSLQTQWTEPTVFHVKEPLKNIKIFLSHSTKDMTLVRQLEQLLDNHGITVIIGEDADRPGSELTQKFQDLIRSSTHFVALLTEDGSTSRYVLMETDYARQINKPMILLKDENARVQLDHQWTAFSKYDPPNIILGRIMDAINKLQNAGTGISPEAAIVGVGILAFILGLALGGDEKK